MGRVGFSKKLSMGENGEDQSACRLDKNTSRDRTPHKFSTVVMIVLNESELNTTSLNVSASWSL